MQTLAARKNVLFRAGVTDCCSNIFEVDILEQKGGRIFHLGQNNPAGGYRKSESPPTPASQWPLLAVMGYPGVKSLAHRCNGSTG